jgi:hypothetical protein
MSNGRWKFALFTGFALLAFAPLPACKGEAEPSVAHIAPGKMPEGASWNGVYFNPVFGNMHLVASGNTIAGKWKRTDGSAWGSLNGPVQGNLFKFEWTEYKIGLVGPSATSKGKGYFLYTRPAGDNVDDELKGEWGLNTSETGNAWDCVKQRHVEPDLKSIGGVEEPGGPGKGWK